MQKKTFAGWNKTAKIYTAILYSYYIYQLVFYIFSSYTKKYTDYTLYCIKEKYL